MDRFKQLLNELNQLVEQDPAPEVLQQAVARLAFELSKDSVSSNRTLGTAKVAVVLPQPSLQVDQDSPAPNSLEITHTKPNITSEQISALPSRSREKSRTKSTPLILFDEELVVEPVETSKPIDAAKSSSQPYDVMEEVPTLYMHRGAELNEQLKADLPSLNDQLKAAGTERQQLLREGPIQDLAKAIGVNERFQFIRELFRNDEAMYERSIKTINQFKVYPEAEYWISRELKTKLGWTIDHPLVNHFDQLIKRRFS